MTSDDHQHPKSMIFANELINLANSSLENGYTADDLAEGMRHAAANFSAYAFFRTEETPNDPNKTVESFISFFDYYLSVHEPKEEPGQGLSQTIAKAKDEL